MESASPAPDEIQPTIEVLHNPGFKDKLPFKKILLIALAIILILASIAVAIYLTIKKPAQLSILPPQPSQSKLAPTPTPQSPGAKILDLKDCNISKEQNPLVAEVISDGQDPTLIRLVGNVNNITINTNKSADIDLLSVHGDQRYLFTVNNDPGNVVDTSTGKIITTSSLKRNQMIDVQYNCYSKNPLDKRFKLVSVGVILKR